MNRLLLLCLFLLPALPASAQHELDAYKAFLAANADLPASALLDLHPAGLFARDAGVSFDDALYADSVQKYFSLTAHERSLVNRHGFMATERQRFDSFGSAFLDIYNRDLPVFVSADAILHALHMSYDLILMETERTVLIPKLEALLASLHAALPELAQRYEGVPGMRASLVDMDVYLTVPRILLSSGSPVFPESQPVVDDMLRLIEAEDMAGYPIFAENCRLMDFSQFTVRGHYTQEPELGRYFQASMWLGRTEIYLTVPATDECRASEADVRRQTIGAMLLSEASELSGADVLLDEIDQLIQLFVGESDNVTLPRLRTLGVERASDLLDDARYQAFQDDLVAQSWAGQRILSQILVNGSVTEPNYIQPASAFLLLGQRFVMDSYVTASVVYDKISFEGRAMLRMLPSTLDVLFALGNAAAGQLLEPELERYKYASNLAAVRYLVDAYEPDFWQSSLYNGWLDAIRTLNPPAERSHLPAFMQTAAWWQQKMNGQLAAWAQLRHDNLLYAKQSYTGVPGCMYPYSFVEPVPAFYEAVGRFARMASERFGTMGSTAHLQSYFDFLGGVSDTLASVAQKELDATPLTADEDGFLKRMIFETPDICYETIDGWYPRLFYSDVERARKPDMVVADIHTAPADEYGNYVGWVLHVGTGPVEMAVVVTEVPGVGPVAFTGPVMSYYEHLSTGFERLTDEVWQTAYAAAPSFRPDFVNLYLAGTDGQPRGTSPMLATGIEQSPGPRELPEAPQLVQNYPNPFAEATTIGFSVPTDAVVELAVFDVEGRQVRRLLSQRLQGGHYTVRWDGSLDGGALAASGTYFYRLNIGGRPATGVMTLVR